MSPYLWGTMPARRLIHWRRPISPILWGMATSMPWKELLYSVQIHTGWEDRRARPAGPMGGGFELYRLLHIVDGSYALGEGLGLAQRRAGPGSVLFLPPGTAQHIERGVQTRENTIIFRVCLGDEQPDPRRVWNVDIPLILEPSFAPLVAQQMQPILALWWLDDLRHLRANGLLHLLITHIVEHYLRDYRANELPVRPSTTAIDPRILLAEELLVSRLNTWTTSDMAAAAGMERSAFARLYKQQRGEPPGALLDRARLNYAMACLSSGEPKLANIAASIGFTGLSSFARWFRRHTGATPVEWHRRARQG
ncbi:MAG: AraC family transcriptional regulator [Planctomycetota bacterium]|nr:MAG: AraC family transcriptional regulator [Planctomycetota bacterium]